jgi:hypothetical protein
MTMDQSRHVTQRQSTWPELAMVALVILAGTFLRFLRLDFQSLWRDELGSIQPALTARSIWALARHTPVNDTHPPLSHVILRIWSNIFGMSPAMLRGSSAFIGSLELVAVYLIARRLFEGTWPRVVAVGLSALSLFLLYYSQEVRAYIYVCLFVVIAGERFVAWLEKPSWTNALTYAAATAAAFYTFYLGMFAVLAHGAYLVFEALRGHIGWQRVAPIARPSLSAWRRSWAGVQLLALLLMVPWLLELHAQMAAFQAADSWLGRPTLHLTYHTFLMFWGWEMPPWGMYPVQKRAIVVCAIALSVIAVITVRLFRRLAISAAGGRRSDNRDVSTDRIAPLSFLSAWIIVGFGAPWVLSLLWTYHVFMPRTVIYVIPASQLLVSLAVCRLRSAELGAVAVVLLISPNIGNMPWYYSHYHKEQWRELVPYIEARAQSGDRINQSHRGFWYYGKGSFDVLTPGDIGVVRRVWVIHQTVGFDQDPIATEALLRAAGYRKENQMAFTEIAVTLWTL